MFSRPWKIESTSPETSPAGHEHPLSRLRNEVQALVDGFLRRWPAPYQPGRHLEHFWNLDVQETASEVVIRAEAPGFEPEDFQVEVRGQALSIRACQSEEIPGHKTPFERSIALPPGLDVDHAAARYHQGVLEVRLPKQPRTCGRNIPIQAG